MYSQWGAALAVSKGPVLFRDLGQIRRDIFCRDSVSLAISSFRMERSGRVHGALHEPDTVGQGLAETGWMVNQSLVSRGLSWAL